MTADCFISQSLHNHLIDAGKVETDLTAYEGAPTELSADQLALNNQNGHVFFDK